MKLQYRLIEWFWTPHTDISDHKQEHVCKNKDTKVTAPYEDDDHVWSTNGITKSTGNTYITTRSRARPIPRYICTTPWCVLHEFLCGECGIPVSSSFWTRFRSPSSFLIISNSSWLSLIFRTHTDTAPTEMEVRGLNYSNSYLYLESFSIFKRKLREGKVDMNLSQNLKIDSESWTAKCIHDFFSKLPFFFFHHRYPSFDQAQTIHTHNPWRNQNFKLWVARNLSSIIPHCIYRDMHRKIQIHACSFTTFKKQKKCRKGWWDLSLMMMMMHHHHFLLPKCSMCLNNSNAFVFQQGY